LAKFRQIAKLKIQLILEIFNRQKKSGTNYYFLNHQIDFYIWFSVGSQKYRMMIKEWYFIFG